MMARANRPRPRLKHRKINRPGKIARGAAAQFGSAESEGESAVPEGNRAELDGVLFARDRLRGLRGNFHRAEEVGSLVHGHAARLHVAVEAAVSSHSENAGANDFGFDDSANQRVPHVDGVGDLKLRAAVDDEVFRKDLSTANSVSSKTDRARAGDFSSDAPFAQHAPADDPR